VGISTFNQKDLHADTSTTRHFVNWYPTASLNYSFTNMRRLGINYNGGTRQPSVTQIQPIVTNEDPLNVTIGNPGLKPQFANRLSIFFNDYQVLTDRGIWANVYGNVTQNNISTSVTVDSTGKRTTQYVNVTGTWSMGGYLSYSFKWKTPDIRFDFHVNPSQSNNVSIVDGISNATRSKIASFGTGVSKSKEKKYEIGSDFSASYTTSRSTINTGVNTEYWTYEIQPYGNLYLPLHFQIHADGDINLRPKSAAFPTSNNVVLLNAWVGKKFLKNDALLVKAAVNDLLNQNVGFNRSVNSNFITQNTYSTIKRFGMLSVVWNFAKAGTPAPKERD
jgi:outer membrane receptor protein involved in Fe transport